MLFKHKIVQISLFLSILSLFFLVGCSINEVKVDITLSPTFTQSPTVTMAPVKVSSTPETSNDNVIVTGTLEPTETITNTPAPEQEISTDVSATPSDEQISSTGEPVNPEVKQPPPSPTPNENVDVASNICQEKAAFFTDVTIPDGTFFNQGESFTKTWRFRNEGTCTWTTDYAIVFHSGDNMSAPIEVAFPETVLPGELVDLSVDMKAPTRGGQHQSNWEFKNPLGEQFGAGISGKDLFWVLINVRFLDENDQPQPNPSTLPPPTTPAGCDVVRDQEYENQVVLLINQVRKQNDLVPLEIRSELTSSALAHSTDMACNDFVGHSGSDGSLWTDRILVQGYSPSYATENIYVGFPEFGGTPEGAFDWWMNSQVHRDNILDPKVSEIGVGYVYADQSSYGGYYTINFARQ
ncbi:MAG: NBR1-Ig-like domain-containing protein [Anaerolineales bacterium]